ATPPRVSNPHCAADVRQPPARKRVQPFCCRDFRLLRAPGASAILWFTYERCSLAVAYLFIIRCATHSISAVWGNMYKGGIETTRNDVFSVARSRASVPGLQET